MKPPAVTNLLLATIALLLLALLIRPLWTPSPVAAQSSQPDRLYFEPGVFMLRAADASRQVLGKVAVDLRTGDVWGFPTTTQDPYPTNPVNSKPQVSHPFLLGRFAIEETGK